MKIGDISKDTPILHLASAAAEKLTKDKNFSETKEFIAIKEAVKEMFLDKNQGIFN